MFTIYTDYFLAQVAKPDRLSMLNMIQPGGVVAALVTNSTFQLTVTSTHAKADARDTLASAVGSESVSDEVADEDDGGAAEVDIEIAAEDDEEKY